MTAPITITINVQFGDIEALLEAYLASVEDDGKRNADRKTFEDFMYWLLKRKGEG